MLLALVEVWHEGMGFALAHRLFYRKHLAGAWHIHNLHSFLTRVVVRCSLLLFGCSLLLYGWNIVACGMARQHPWSCRTNILEVCVIQEQDLVVCFARSLFCWLTIVFALWISFILCLLISWKILSAPQASAYFIREVCCYCVSVSPRFWRNRRCSTILWWVASNLKNNSDAARQSQANNVSWGVHMVWEPTQRTSNTSICDFEQVHTRVSSRRDV